VENKQPLPVVLYDDTCGFCSRTMRAWRVRAGGRVAFEPSEGSQACRLAGSTAGSVRLVEPDGTVLAGAAAVFRLMTLSGQPVGALLLRLHRVSTVFRAASEFLYGIVARRRVFVSRVLGLRPDRVV
jgi:predicted DCC family thiol-disulfide oxidoreductase YuxK